MSIALCKASLIAPYNIRYRVTLLKLTYRDHLLSLKRDCRVTSVGQFRRKVASVIALVSPARSRDKLNWREYNPQSITRLS